MADLALEGCAGVPGILGKKGVGLVWSLLLKMLWSDFLWLPMQVEDGPSEFALYTVHESGGKC